MKTLRNGGWHQLVRWATLWALWLALPAWANLELQLGHQFPVGSIPDRTARRFAELVQEKSLGRLRVQVHPAAVFGDERDHLMLLRKHALDFAITGDLVVSSLGDRYLVVNLPFVYRDTAHALRIYEGELGEQMRAELRQRGLVALSWHTVGVRVLTANRPVRTLADLKGLVLRLPQDASWIAAWRALGALPQQVPFNELPGALRLGRVEAQENPPNFIRASKLYEHQKFLMTTHHMPQRQFVFAAADSLARLDARQRKLVTDAAREASRLAVEWAQAESGRDLQWLTTEGGMTLVEFDATGVREALQAVPKALAGSAGEAVYQQIVSRP